jgi:TatA/E family protein of Tat protein translocase
MLSFPHLVVLFVIALVIFGPQKLPELARMLGKATAEFRKMTSDFRYALEDEVRELERQTRIREEEVAAAARAAQPAPAPPEGAVERVAPGPEDLGQAFVEPSPYEVPDFAPDAAPQAAPETPQHDVTAQDEKPSDDHTAV